ncbi:hypothetical protein BX070DRAFT_218548 [Coemansia spiralis]|nr:hypothetical protein BX070DRAFT_218548 [Coemansia spiralis]
MRGQSALFFSPNMSLFLAWQPLCCWPLSLTHFAFFAEKANRKTTAWPPFLLMHNDAACSTHLLLFWHFLFASVFLVPSACTLIQNKQSTDVCLLLAAVCPYPPYTFIFLFGKQPICPTICEQIHR